MNQSIKDFMMVKKLRSGKKDDNTTMKDTIVDQRTPSNNQSRRCILATTPVSPANRLLSNNTPTKTSQLSLESLTLPLSNNDYDSITPVKQLASQNISIQPKLTLLSQRKTGESILIATKRNSVGKRPLSPTSDHFVPAFEKLRKLIPSANKSINKVAQDAVISLPSTINDFDNDENIYDPNTLPMTYLFPISILIHLY